MMVTFRPSPKPQTNSSEMDTWRAYAARVSRAVRERREDAYFDTGKSETGARPSQASRTIERQLNSK